MKCSEASLTFESQNFKIRPPQLDDSDFILELLNEPAFIRNIGDKKVRTVAEAHQYLSKAPIAGYEFLGTGLYIVQLKETSSPPLGIVSLLKRESLTDADIGYAFLQRHWGKGHAFEASLALLNFARDNLGLKRILGVTLPDNLPSVRLLEKLGLRFEGNVKLADDKPESKLFGIDF